MEGEQRKVRGIEGGGQEEEKRVDVEELLVSG